MQHVTDTKEKPALTAERFIAKLRRRDATSGKRLHEALRAAEYRFNRRESAWRCDRLAEVIEAERGPAVAMAQALGLEIDAQPGHAPPDVEYEHPDVADEPTPDPPVQPQGEQVYMTSAGGPTEPDMSRATVTIDGAPVDVPERLREPLPESRLKIGRGR